MCRSRGRVGVQENSNFGKITKTIRLEHPLRRQTYKYPSNPLDPPFGNFSGTAHV